MYSWAAIWASVRPWATRVTSSRSRALSLPRPGRRGRLRAGVGEQQGVLGGGGQAHRRAAFLGCPRPVGSQRLAGRAQRFLPAPRVSGPVRAPLVCRSAAYAAHSRDGLGGRPVAAHRCPQPSRPSSAPTAAGLERELSCLPQVRRGVAGAAGLQVQVCHHRQQRAQGRTGRPRPGPGPAWRRRPARRRPGPRPRPGTRPAGNRTPGRAEPGMPRDLLGLPGQLHGTVRVAGIRGGDGRDPYGMRLGGWVAQLTGHGQGAAGHPAASGTRPRLAKVTDRPARQSASARDGSRSPIASTIAAKRPSAAGRSAASIAV